MTLTVLYFAAVRDLVGKDEERVDVPSGVVTIDQLGRFLAVRYPGLADRLGHVRFARNEEFVALGDSISDGDVVALIPPVAGG